jgi:hypothetical protein
MTCCHLTRCILCSEEPDFAALISALLPKGQSEELGFYSLDSDHALQQF